jgi:hypothetical protein
MTAQASSAQIVEMQMIRSDTRFYYDFFNCVTASGQSGILMLCLIPCPSLFVIETYGYFTKTQPTYAQQIRLQHEGLLRSIRNKVKLFEEDDVTKILESVANYQRTYFIDSHTGFLAPLKKLLQDDLGLFFYSGHLIGNTHISFSYLAHERDASGAFAPNAMQQISALSHPVGYDIGRYVSHLYHDLVGMPGADSTKLCENKIDDNLVQTKDVKSTKYFTNIFNGPSSVEINSCLLLLTSFLNVVHFVLRKMVVGDPDTFLKLKYLTLYQVCASLKKLKNFYFPTGLLTKKSKEFLELILKDKELSFALSQPKFRNILVHYSLDGSGFPESKIDLNTRLFGLVEHVYSGYTAEDLDALVDRQLTKIFGHMEQWLHNGES